MIDSPAWPPLFLARQDRAQREHTHFKNLLQPQTVTTTESQFTEIVATKPLILQTQVREKNSDTLATQAVLSAEFIGSFKNNSSPRVTLVATIASTPNYPALPSVYPIGLSDTDRYGFVASSHTMKKIRPIHDLPTPSPVSMGLTQGHNLLALTSLKDGPLSFSSIEFNANPTSLISSPTNTSRHLNSLSIVISTSSTLSFASLIASTPSLPTSNFDSGVKTTSLPFVRIESMTPYEIISVPITTMNVENAISSTSLNIASPTGSSSHHTSHHAPNTPVVIGGVMGSIAGLAVITFFVMILLRWHRSSKWLMPLGNEDISTISGVPQSVSRAQLSDDMIQQRPLNFSRPAVLTSFSGDNLTPLKKCKLATSIDAGEKGFYRVSGRKLPSVLQFGGDGYGDNILRSNIDNGSSLDHHSRDSLAGSGSPSRSTLTVTASHTGGFNPVIQPDSPLNPMVESDLLQPPQRPDAISRSRPSTDGSLTSRFTEEV